jgi:hypothetical protein
MTMITPVRKRVRRSFCESCETLAELRPLALWIPGDARRRYLKACKCGIRIIHLEDEGGSHVTPGQA